MNPSDVPTHPLQRIRQSLATVLIGQQQLVDRLLIGLLTGGHLLLEGVPGLAKTLAARSLAQATGLQFRRVQFTPDLLPADLLGTEVFHPKTGEFSVRKGPIFTQILLTDEINRAPAKVQSALLEAMQEHQVTLGLETFPLPEPFFVLATQNPIEHEGTYPLPEAQVDRFLMKVVVDYPDREDERRILQQMAVTAPDWNVPICLEVQELMALRRTLDAVYLDAAVADYILDLVRATRSPAEFGLDVGRWIELGASPRAGIALVLASKAVALLDQRDYVLPHDVKSIAADVLRHRILLSFEAEAEEITADSLVHRFLEELPVP